MHFVYFINFSSSKFMTREVMAHRVRNLVKKFVKKEMRSNFKMFCSDFKPLETDSYILYAQALKSFIIVSFLLVEMGLELLILLESCFKTVIVSFSASCVNFLSLSFDIKEILISNVPDLLRQYS